MSFLSSMNISASGLSAQRLRLDIASENIANIDTTRTQEGGPYKRKMVVFEPISQSSFKNALNYAMNKEDSAGVRVSDIVEDETPFKAVYNPNHPDADENGYVMMPNVNSLQEIIDSMSASRAYDANVTAFNAIKQMASKALEIGK